MNDRQAHALTLAAALAAAFPAQFREPETGQLWARRIEAWPPEVVRQAVDWLIDTQDRPTIRMLNDRCRMLLDGNRQPALPAYADLTDDERQALREQMRVDVERIRKRTPPSSIEAQAFYRDRAHDESELRLAERFPCALCGEEIDRATANRGHGCRPIAPQRESEEVHG